MLPMAPAAMRRSLLRESIEAVSRPSYQSSARGPAESPARGRPSTGRNLGFVRHLHLGHVLVALGGEPQRIVAELDRRILDRPLGRLAGRQALDHGVVVECLPTCQSAE